MTLRYVARVAGTKASAKPIAIYLEIGAKRTFACAVDWPGWSRSGRDEDQAITALLDSAPRYAKLCPAPKR